MPRNIFTDHPHTVNESYSGHLRSALSFAAAMMGGALLCSIHAFLPFMFERSGSDTVRRLYGRMVTYRHNSN